MNATTQQQLTTFQTVRLTDLVALAASGFKKKHVHKTGGVATDEEIDAFVKGIEPGIIKSILKAGVNHEAEKREDRLKAVKALAVLHGVKFTHRREQDEVEGLIKFDVVSPTKVVETIEVDLVNATRGGQTFAFKYVLDDANDLSIVYAAAFCRDDENFDPLIGMEESLKKFLLGRLLVTPITHERFGQVKLTQLSDEYKAAENLSKEIIAADAELASTTA